MLTFPLFSPSSIAPISLYLLQMYTSTYTLALADLNSYFQFFPHSILYYHNVSVLVIFPFPTIPLLHGGIVSIAAIFQIVCLFYLLATLFFFPSASQ